jgi:hypothetical protein
MNQMTSLLMARNRDSHKKLAPIEQEGQETTTEDPSSEDQNFDSMIVKELKGYCKQKGITGYSKYVQQEVEITSLIF